MKSDDLAVHKNSLEDSIDSLDGWIIGFTWPVAIGLLMEFYAVLNFAWSRDWNTVVDRMGLFLVTAGVAGELAIEHRSHWAGRKLREVSDEIERESQSNLKKADERIAGLERDTAKAIERAEIEHHARVKIEKEMLPRRLTGSQKEKLVKMLRTRPPDGVGIVSAMMDPESADFADDLDIAISEAGWRTSRIRNHVSHKYGIFVGFVPGGGDRPGADLLRDSIGGIGFLCEDLPYENGDASMAPAFEPGYIYLVVEHKPHVTIDDRAERVSEFDPLNS